MGVQENMKGIRGSPQWKLLPDRTVPVPMMKTDSDFLFL